MKYLTEKQVLKKLGIPNFSHLSKDNFIKFVSMLPNMENEVATKMLDQFPNFADTSREVMNDYKSIVENTLKSNDDSTKQCYAIYNRVIDSLNTMLDKGDDLSIDEKMMIASQMKEVADLASAKDTENKQFLAGVIAFTGAVALGITAILSSTLGTKIELPYKDEPENEEDNSKDNS